MAQITKKTTTRSIFVSLPRCVTPGLGPAAGLAQVRARRELRGSIRRRRRWYPDTQRFNRDPSGAEPSGRTRLACELMRGKYHVAVAVADDTGERARRGLAARLPAAPLLPVAARRPAAILGLCCLVLVVGLGALFAHQSRPDALDRVVRAWILGLHIPLTDMSDVSRIGGTTATTVLTVALAFGCLAARRVSGAMLAVVGVAVASALTEWVVKPVVDRTITIHHYVSYPSGHTTGLFALSAVLAVVLLSARPARPRQAARVAAVAGAVVVSAAVGVAMIGLDFHYFTDTVAGAAVGTGVVLGAAFLLDCDVVRHWVGRVGR